MGCSPGSRLHLFTLGNNPIAASNCAKFIELLTEGNVDNRNTQIQSYSCGFGVPVVSRQPCGLNCWGDSAVSVGHPGESGLLFSPVGANDLRTLIDMGYVEIQNDVPVLTSAGLEEMEIGD